MKSTHAMRNGGSRSNREGFSLIELLAVMVILSILMVFLAFRLGGMGETAKASMTGTFLTQIGGAAAEYEQETGGFPGSSWKSEWGALPNKQNLGIEILCVTLWSKKYGGSNLPEDSLDNTDGDRAKKSLTTHASSDLFELVDSWGNPIAYFHHRDYGREDVYLTADAETGEWLESTAKALRNPKTGNYYNPREFQLISAGIDGEFGTYDDLTNFKRDKD